MQVEKIDCTNEENISAAAAKFFGTEMLLNSLGFETLRRLLDKFIWRDADTVRIDRLWEYFATYYYLPRLAESRVLLATIQKGVAAKIFGVAEDFCDGEFLELKFGEESAEISLDKILVKAEAAEKIFKPATTTELPTQTTEDDDEAKKISDDEKPPEDFLPTTEPTTRPLPRRFSMDAELYSVRAAAQLKKHLDEIAVYLMDLPDAETSIHVAIKIYVPGGISEDLQKIVEESCSERGIDAEHFRFEE